MHVVARILLYGVAWFLTSTTFIMLFDWADKQQAAKRRVQRVQKSDNRFAGVVTGAVIWAIIIGIIYW
jgi:predicted PurR-regulated permease PerM